MLNKIGEYLTEKEKRKILEIERQMTLDTRQHEIAMKKLDLEEKFTDAGNYAVDNLDKLSMEQMDRGWKDEFIMFILFFPLIISFIPGIQDTATQGFTIMKSVPDWYMYLVVAIVTVVYGLRSLVRFLITHKSTKAPQVSVFQSGQQANQTVDMTVINGPEIVEEVVAPAAPEVEVVAPETTEVKTVSKSRKTKE